MKVGVAQLDEQPTHDQKCTGSLLLQVHIKLDFGTHTHTVNENVKNLLFAFCINLHCRRQFIWTYCNDPEHPQGVTCWLDTESSMDWQIRHIVWSSKKIMKKDFKNPLNKCFFIYIVVIISQRKTKFKLFKLNF